MTTISSVSPEFVRRVRRYLNETQAQFARRLHVDPVTVARWETGRRRCAGQYAEAVQLLAPATDFRPGTEDATISALAQLARTLFEGSTATAVTALLDHETLSDEDLDALGRLIESKKKKGRPKVKKEKR
jgi:transcriptional regulator with XRE-family HTH domain